MRTRKQTVGLSISKIGLASFAIVTAVVPSNAQQMFDEKGMRNLGMHAGRSQWALRNCNGRESKDLQAMGMLGKSIHPHAFKQGFDAGMTDALKAEKNSGRDVACVTMKILYGRNGSTVPNLVEW